MTTLKELKRDWTLMQFVKNPSKERQITAVTQNPSAMYHIDNPCIEALLICIRQDRYWLSKSTPEFFEMYPEYFL